MKILITGGAGFIGSEMVQQLNVDADKEKNNIIVLDSLSEQVHGKEPEKSFLYNKIKGKCTFIYGDITDYATVEKAVGDCDYLIHLAAETGTGQSMYSINRYNDVNIMGTSNLLQVISKGHGKVKKIILASSRSVYGEGKYYCSKHGVVYPQGRKKEDMLRGDFGMHCPKCGRIMDVVPTDEESPILPNSLYAFTKFAQEKMIETMCQALGIDYTIFRFQNVYGAGQSLKNPYTGILSIFSTRMLKNEPINIFEDGMESRDFIHVKDVAAAVIASLDSVQTNGEVINLGSGRKTSVLEIAERLKKRYNSRSELKITGDFRMGDIAHNCADITKAKELMNFETTISMENGLQDFCRWVMGQGTENSDYEESLKEMENAGMFIRKEGQNE